MTKRKFIWTRPDGREVTIPDPDRSLSVEEAIQFVAGTTHPELTNAVVTYREPVGDVQQIALGAKGAGAKGGASPAVVQSGAGKGQEVYDVKTSIGRKA